jgi:hypothetical protein
MCSAEISIHGKTSTLKRPAGAGAAERFPEDFIEAVDRIEHAGSQIVERRGAVSPEQPSGKDGD